MSNVDVYLQYEKLTTGSEVIDSLTTDETGGYSFSSLVPGQYTISASKLPEYKVDVDTSIFENETTNFNVSIEYAKIALSGRTKDIDTGATINNISIEFLPDFSVVNNTAQSSSSISSGNGAYTALIMPGRYNVTVNQVVNESGINVTYVYSEQLNIQIGEGTKTFDILMTKE